ncbi:type VI immunity family protein [Edaphovirga cremea]|uniref:type VI immunity family protein n=1 Tax=Edaphovirga cremea TaxID=2267246 RepID=UPI000DEF84A7|nr:type VI immunity family protein [Edaphovirga cremea]
MTGDDPLIFWTAKYPSFLLPIMTVSRLAACGNTLEKREKILNCFHRFRQEFGSHLRFHRHEFKGMLKYSDENIAKVEKSILTKGIYDYGGWYISDAHSADEAPNYLMHYLDSGDDNENANSYLSLLGLVP